MKKSRYGIIVIVILLLTLNPKMIKIYKDNVSNVKYNITEVKELSVGYGENTDIIKYKKGILTYDGKTLNYIDSKAQRVFSLNICINNYNIDTNQEYIYILDKINKIAYIIDKSGSIKTKAVIPVKPISIRAMPSDKFLISYSTDVDVEGIKIYDYYGKELKDISIPKISINFVSIDKDSGGILISGMSTEKDSLSNNLFYYDQDGNLQFSDSEENIMFIQSYILEDRIILVDPKYVEIRDKDFKIINRLNMDDKIISINMFNDDLGIMLNSNKYILISKNGNIKNIDAPIENIKGFNVINGNTVLYNDRSVYFPNLKQEYNTAKDIITLENIDGENFIIVFRDIIKFMKLN